MSTMKDAWFMVKADLRGNKFKMLRMVLFTVAFIGYFSILTGSLIMDALVESERPAVVDFLMLTMIPLLGFTVNRRTTKYLTEDSYTRMQVYQRFLPIPSAVVLCKRKIQASISFGVNGLIYFGVIYAICEQLRLELNIPSYLAFSLTWIGYGLTITGIYIFIELLFSGKAYFWLTFLLMIVSGGVSFLIMLAKGNLFLSCIDSSREWGLLSPVMWGSLLVGVMSVQLFSKWTIHRMKSRNLV